MKIFRRLYGQETKSYEMDDGYIIDITVIYDKMVNRQFIEAWFHHPDYGVKHHLVGFYMDQFDNDYQKCRDCLFYYYKAHKDIRHQYELEVMD